MALFRWSAQWMPRVVDPLARRVTDFHAQLQSALEHTAQYPSGCGQTRRDTSGQQTRITKILLIRPTDEWAASNDEFQPPATTDMCANARSTAHLVTYCSCLAARFKEMN